MEQVKPSKGWVVLGSWLPLKGLIMDQRTQGMLWEILWHKKPSMDGCSTMVLKVDGMGWIGLDGSPGGGRYRAPYDAKDLPVKSPPGGDGGLHHTSNITYYSG